MKEKNEGFIEKLKSAMTKESIERIERLGSQMIDNMSHKCSHLELDIEMPNVIDSLNERLRPEFLAKPEITHDSIIESIEKSNYKSPELLIAIKAWLEIFGDNGLFHKASIKEKQSPVKFIKKHLKEKYKITDTRKLDRISTIVNYRKK